MYKIEIDNDVWAFLKLHAEPFTDNPNTVLRRLLLKDDPKINQHTKNDVSYTDFPELPSHLPRALVHILEVTHLVTLKKYPRTTATSLVARRRNIFPQTVLDKYCRQLDKKAHEIDVLLQSQNLGDFKQILTQKFPNFKFDINNFFDKLTSG